MGGSAGLRPTLFGRDKELTELERSLEGAIAGRGSAVLVSGEPGIGKTALVEKFLEHASARGVKVLAGFASADSAQPFLMFSKALEGRAALTLFEEQEDTGFVEIFAINHSGLLVAQAASAGGDTDADIFAGMLAAVQNFVHDSLGRGAAPGAGLARLEYGDMKILIEHGAHLFLTGVFSGAEHPDMKAALKLALRTIESEHAGTLSSWSGSMSEVRPIQETLGRLIGVRFAVRRDLEGIKLDSERLKIADRFLSHLLGISEDGPTMLLLEDVHWADESSRFVLRYTIRNLAGSNVLVLCTSRPAADPGTAAFLAGVREAVTTEISLTGLDLGGIRTLIDSRFHPNDFSERLAGRLLADCAGNPFFISAILDQMAVEGTIAGSGGAFALAREDFILPGTVEDAVMRRLGSLDPESLAMVEYVSCMGCEFPTDAALSFTMAGDPGVTLESLRSQGFVQTQGSSVRFSHALVQDTVYRHISPRWKAAYHRKLGEHFERAGRDRPTDFVYELAHHFGRAGVWHKSLEYSPKAAAAAEASHAYEQAAEFYQNALDAADRMAPSPDQETVIGLVERTADAKFALGRFQECQGHLDRVMELARDEDVKARVWRKRAAVLERKGDLVQSVAAAEKALELDASPRELARALNQLSQALMRQGLQARAIDCCMRVFAEAPGELEAEIAKAHSNLGQCYTFQGEYAKAEEQYTEANKLFERLGDTMGLAANLTNISIVYAQRGDPAKAIEGTARSIALKEKLGDIYGLSSSYNNQGVNLNMMGDLDGARRAHEHSLRIREKVGDKRGIGTSLNNLGVIAQDRGDYAEAEARFRKSLAIRREINDRWGQVKSLNNLGGLLRLRGELRQAREMFEASLELQKDTQDKTSTAQAYGNLSLVLNDLGDPDEALVLARKSLGMGEENGDAQVIVGALNSIGSVELSMGDPGGARRTFGDAVERARAKGSSIHVVQALHGLARSRLALGQHEAASEAAFEAMAVSSEKGLRVEGASSRAVHGAAAVRLGKEEEGLREIAEARHELETIGNLPAFAVATVEHAESLRHLGRDGEARRLFLEALALFDRMGMRNWAGRCREAIGG